MRSTLCVLLLAAAAAPAHAQPAAPPEGGGYPVDVSQRPLLLPSGLVEAGAELRTYFYGGDPDLGLEAFDVVHTDLSARAGLGPVEARLDAQLMLAQPEGSDQDALTRVGAGFAAGVAPSLAVTGRFGFLTPTQTDWESWTAEAGVVARQRGAPTTAFQGGAGMRYENYGGGALGASFYTLWLDAVGIGQVQATPLLAMDGRFRLSVPVADDYDFEGYPRTQASLLMRGLITLPRVDLYAGLEVLSIVPEISQRTVVAGVAGRLP